MRRDFFGADGDTTWNLERLRRTTKRFTHHDLDIRDRDAISASSPTTRPDLVVHCAAQPSHDLARAAPVRRLRGQRARHAEPARGHAAALPRVAVRLHEHEQGLRRRAERAAARRARDALGLRRPGGRARASPRAAGSTRRCTACSARRSSPPTCSSRSTDATSACRRSASAAAASPGRTTPAPSCTASSPTSPARPRGPDVPRSSATRASRCATTSTRTTSARRCSPSTRRRAGGRLQPRRRPREQRLGPRGDRPVRGAGRPPSREEYVDEARARRSHLLHQRPAPAARRLSRLGHLALARRHPGS